MEHQTDINKAVRQHAEMAEYFSGGITVKKFTAEHAETTTKEIKLNPVNSEVSALRKNASLETIKEIDGIAEESRRCRKCDLGELRTNAVPGEGSPSARIMFVGEAPGADEDAQGRPFVGRAGQLLDKIIAACGLKRQDVWIGNILKCRPPDNRDPRPEEIVACLPFLQRQIELINPEVIVALGAHAAKTLLDTPKSIGQLRGLFHDYVPGIGHRPIKLMPTFHPAYLLRNYSDENRRKVWEDMKKVLTEIGLPIP
ncbi:MAG: uracil-DNA glycosylase [Sedimentisphaerales bacterium]|nr:uracil-DNA glycosylase [Sedimentisphaerales bacterium]